MTEASDSNTPKPTPTLMEDLDAVLSWVPGPNFCSEKARLRAALERLEQLSGNPGELDDLRAEVAALTEANAKASEVRTVAANRITELQAEIAALRVKLEEAESQLRALPTPDSALQNLGEYLTSLLDSDQWNHAVGYLEAARIYQQAVEAKLERMEKGNYEGVAGIIALNEQLKQCARVRDQWKEDAQTFSEKAEFAESRATELAARVEALESGLNALLDQIDRGTFVDQHGHDARMLKAVHDGMALMTSTPAADLAGGKDEPR